MTTSEHVSLSVDGIDFTPEETWRLLRWCAVQGADEFTVDFHEVQGGGSEDPLKAFLLRPGEREHNRHPFEGTQDRTLYRLNEESIAALRGIFPSGLFQDPSYGSTEPWAEDPVVYRHGRLMLEIISHDGFGELRITKAEEAVLAARGVRGGFIEGESPSAALSIGPSTMRVLTHEFPCLSGGPEDDWLRVHFTIESIPRVFVGYHTLNVTLPTIDAWRRHMDEMLAGTVSEATLRTAGPGLSLRMAKADGGQDIKVTVDGRQMGTDLPGHLWTFSVEAAAVGRLCGECVELLRERQGRPDTRPRAALPNDPERTIRLGRRRLLVA